MILYLVVVVFLRIIFLKIRTKKEITDEVVLHLGEEMGFRRNNNSHDFMMTAK